MITGILRLTYTFGRVDIDLDYKMSLNQFHSSILKDHGIRLRTWEDKHINQLLLWNDDRLCQTLHCMLHESEQPIQNDSHVCLLSYTNLFI